VSWSQLEYSKSQVKRAGTILRAHATDILSHTQDEVDWAEAVARNWRRAHAEAENWAQMGCRSRLRTLGLPEEVTQRLKELPTIVRKLVREGNRVQLSTMEDIAGARAIVPTLDDVRALEGKWLDSSSYPVHRHRDYNLESPETGYRAVHLVMRHKERLVEIQIRTAIQNAWAELVEDLGHLTGTALKNGEGPPGILDQLRVLSDRLATIDQGQGYSERRTEALALVEAFRTELQGEYGRDIVPEITRFLLIFDHELGRLVEPPREFVGDAQAEKAFDAYDAAEVEFADRRDHIEVLLVGAESLDTVRVTHGRFFRNESGSRDFATSR
jgi:putative GTP pyrophosphokinase